MESKTLKTLNFKFAGKNLDTQKKGPEEHNKQTLHQTPILRIEIFSIFSAVLINSEHLQKQQVITHKINNIHHGKQQEQAAKGRRDQA
jgi:hypothetical protein